MTTALAFQETTFDIIDRLGSPWLRLHQIGVALKYSRPDAVNKIYQSNADEFTDQMTAVVELDTPGGKQKTRIFSLRGAHLLAMLARTPVAKEFRKWVLDILDREAMSAPISRTTITPEQKSALHAIIDRRVNGYDSLRAGMWKRHNQHFNINSYHELLAVHFDDAVTYLETMELKTPKAKALPPAVAPVVALPLPGRQRLLLVIEDGIITNCKQVDEAACIINPKDTTSISTMLNEYVPYSSLPAVIQECVNRMSRIAGNMIGRTEK